MSDDEELFDGGLFEEPENFRPPKPESHFVKYERKYYLSEVEHGVKEINLRLVGKSPLWGHLLWNAGVYTGNWIEKNAREYITNKKIVEFGAASGLPSLLCSLNNASKVICTDYPDPELLENIRYNIDHLGYSKAKEIIEIEGFIWGNETNEISKKLGSNDGKADFLIMSDLVFNHTEHHKLLKSCKELIKPLINGKSRSGGKCLVVWSPHRPKLLDNDLKFFSDAAELYNFDVELIEMVHWDHPMFPEEPVESEEIRKRVYCYMLHPTW
ncbi:nicotinamide n-methyltransferase [Pichia californica]|uniref:Nicotinamide n-methyltransferase n=1 Tax=Pichia californica TaxID=460514 RepID=A0A9P6WMD0_9ASCO|nr:nicotinamide n-methyltransferase [[Candida] californica]KAG0688777.1 nicotinamide n-methyltransferase [[Candida] californica]